MGDSGSKESPMYLISDFRRMRFGLFDKMACTSFLNYKAVPPPLPLSTEGRDCDAAYSSVSQQNLTCSLTVHPKFLRRPNTTKLTSLPFRWCLKLKIGWGDGLASRALTTHMWDPSSESQNTQNARRCTCLLSLWHDQRQRQVPGRPQAG